MHSFGEPVGEKVHSNEVIERVFNKLTTQKGAGEIEGNKKVWECIPELATMGSHCPSQTGRNKERQQLLEPEESSE